MNPNQSLPTLDDLDAAGKRILIRVDFNAPLADGQISDDTRLNAALPTILELLDAGASLVLMSHLGRPKGEPKPELRMAPVAAALAELLGREVIEVQGDPVLGEGALATCQALEPGQVALLENLRFDPGEKSDDPAFAAGLAALADAYVNDAFGTAHRPAASVVGVAGLLPAYAGRLLHRELEVLGAALSEPKRPFIVVMGGAKIGDKIGVIDALLPLADRILVGGGMANTFLAAEGVEMANSLVETDRLDDARRLRALAGDKLVVPFDLLAADAFDEAANTRIVGTAKGVPKGWQALDIGPATVEVFKAALADAGTVIWNGPMGVFEMVPFAKGTYAVAEILAGLNGAMTIVGGGDSAAAVHKSGLADKMGWISTGGGAALELLEGRPLPAVVALLEARS